ncbi:hypothetical protein AB0L70_14530 [Kribbella sp. NPDC051952]|uniref:hypothetical protein n=1 Tax=Kribbella sp. NPDC051952 TaxID=3154851 RepID=UPI0034159200
MPDQPDALDEARSNVQAAQDHLRGVSDMILDALAADDLLAGGQSTDDSPGQAKR